MEDCLTIECNKCEVIINGEVVGSAVEYDEQSGIHWKAGIVKCPKCKGLLFGIAQLEQTGFDTVEFTDAERKWPEPEQYVDRSIPDVVRASLEEAKRCMRAKAYLASSVMCGRAVEGICFELLGSKPTLFNALKELRNKALIDGRLYEWGEELRKKRNLGAHANAENISALDARDLLDFAMAMSEFIFVLSTRFEAFKTRQGLHSIQSEG